MNFPGRKKRAGNCGISHRATLLTIGGWCGMGAVGVLPKTKTARCTPPRQNVLMLKLKNTPFCDLKISKLLPLPYRSIPRYTNTPFSSLAIDLFLRKGLH